MEENIVGIIIISLLSYTLILASIKEWEYKKLKKWPSPSRELRSHLHLLLIPALINSLILLGYLIFLDAPLIAFVSFLILMFSLLWIILVIMREDSNQ